MQRWPQTALLHDHLDGSRTLLPILPELYRLSGKLLPFEGNIDIHEGFKLLFANPQIDLVKKFSYATGVMQSKETLSLAAENYVQTRAQQGFLYCEATIAPQYHVFGGLTIREAIGALIEGIKRGEDKHPQIEINLLLSVGREVSSDKAVELVESFADAAERDRDYCPGVGLVCDEASHPPVKHFGMFRRAYELGFKTSCHAGEWVRVPPDFNKDLPKILNNISAAIYILGANRIGHAIGLDYDPGLVKKVVKYNVGVEGCPGSNLTSGLIKNVGQLGIRDLLQNGVIYSLNPDDDLFMPDIDETFHICDDWYNFTEEEKEKLLRNPWLSRFGNRKEHKF